MKLHFWDVGNRIVVKLGSRERMHFEVLKETSDHSQAVFTGHGSRSWPGRDPKAHFLTNLLFLNGTGMHRDRTLTRAFAFITSNIVIRGKPLCVLLEV